MKTWLRESLWLIAVLVIAVLSYGIILGDTALDVGMHDMYINVNGANRGESPVGANIFVFAISLSFLVYLVRVLFGKFRNIPTNLILIVIAGIDLFYFSSNLIFYATTTVNSSMGIITGGTPGSLIVYRLLKVFLILTLAATAFMTGRTWERS
jgi:hypothetical protein